MKSGIFILIVLSFSLLHGQDLKLQEIGVMGGPSITHLRHEKRPFGNAYKPNKGFASGIYFQRNLTSKFSLRAECLYEFKTARVQCLVMNDNNGNYIEEEVTGIMRFHSISLPILAKFSFGSYKRFFIESGPVFSRITNAEISVPPAAKMPAQVWDLSDQSSKFELGLAAGFGFQTYVRYNLILSLHVRDHLGFTSVFNNNNWLPTRSNAAYIMGGLAFQFSSMFKSRKDPVRLY